LKAANCEREVRNRVERVVKDVVEDPGPACRFYNKGLCTCICFLYRASPSSFLLKVDIEDGQRDRQQPVDQTRVAYPLSDVLDEM
jgi:hypothetical protein